MKVIGAVVSAAAMLAACGSATEVPVDGANAVQAAEAQPANAAAQQSSAPSAAPAAAPAALSESDRLQLEGARAACGTNDFNAFLFVYLQSSAVQARFTADRVDAGPEGSSQSMSGAAYLERFGPSIRALDHSFYSGDSVRAWEQAMATGRRTELEPIVWVLNSASDNRHRVDWSRAQFDGVAEEGPGRPTALIGEPGALLFHPTEDRCWELVADFRPSRPGSISLEDVQQ